MVLLWLVSAFVAALLCACVSRWIMAVPYGDFDVKLVVRLFELYSRIVHRVRYENRAVLAGVDPARPVLVVCNHTAGVDPILVQAELPFRARWVMAQDMRSPLLEWFWRWSETIFVDRAGGNTLGVRQIIGRLKQGQSVGIFPEGGLERPPEQIMPFMTGIGLVIGRTGVPVLPVWITGTPQVNPAWASLRHFSNAEVRFGEVMTFEGERPDEIVRRLQQHFLDWTGWPLNEDNSHIPAPHSALAAS